MLKKPRPNLLMTELDGEAVLLDIESSYYFSLNETGTRVWRGLEADKSLEEIVDGIVAEWDVTPDEARETVESFLAALEKEGLIR